MGGVNSNPRYLGRPQLKQRLATRTEEYTKPKEGRQRQPARTPASWIVPGRDREDKANCGCGKSSGTINSSVVGTSPGIRQLNLGELKHGTDRGASEERDLPYLCLPEGRRLASREATRECF